MHLTVKVYGVCQRILETKSKGNSKINRRQIQISTTQQYTWASLIHLTEYQVYK